MAPSAHDSVVQHIPHIPALNGKTIHPPTCTLAWLAFRAFRAMQRAAPSEKQALRAKLNNNDGNTWTAVHLLSAEEVLGIFGGVAAGLGFSVRIICISNQTVRC